MIADKELTTNCHFKASGLMYSPWQQSSHYKFHVSEIEMFQEMNFSHVSLESFNIWKLSKAQDAIFHQALAWKMIDDQLFSNLSTHTQSRSFLHTNRWELNHFSLITQLQNCTLTFLQFSRSQQALRAATNQPENKKMQHGNELQQAGPRLAHCCAIFLYYVVGEIDFT